MTIRKYVAIIVALTLTATLVGCASETGAPKNQTGTQTETQPQTYEAGATVDPETPLADGQKAYALPDGTYVVVDKTQPLPPAVQTDLNAKAATSLSGKNDGTNPEVISKATGEALSYTAKNTGKRVVLVVKVYGFATATQSSKADFWAVMGADNSRHTSKASAEAAVSNWLATADNAETYAVVWTG